MRFGILILAFSIFMSGYCAASHAFGEIPMQGKADDNIMSGMPDCPIMKANVPAGSKSQHPPKVSLNCKICCAVLIGFTENHTVIPIAINKIDFLLSDHMMQSDFRFRIFHPPKFLS